MYDLSMDRPVAYFCAEYALDPNLPIYAGGLGVLAGDYLREAADQNFPIVGVGLFYNYNNTAKLDLVTDSLGNTLHVETPIQDRKVYAQVFRYMVGSNPVYLLDTNISENDPADRQITYKIYPEDRETRLKQAIVLGIGGLRALEALRIHPCLYHLNEGHSALLSLELIRHEIQERGIDFKEAVMIARKRIVFTNHTLVVTGHDTYGVDLVTLALTGYAQELGVPVSEVVKLGLVEESPIFSMTMLSLRMADSVNAVSKLHAQIAADIWADHPMIPITNGIHLGTWDKVKDVNNHHVCKKELLKLIQDTTDVKWEPNQLLLGWARRFVEYKHPLAILENLQRFMNIAHNSQFPVKLVFSGQPHESDANGRELLQKLKNLILNRIGDSVVYLPDYTLETARILTSGCDVWLNTPLVGFEACGTSGMKAALNGVLPVTTRDGWVDEVDLYKVGWILDSNHLGEKILDVLEYEVVPMYYEKPKEWQELMKNARNLIIDRFSTTRMLKQYQKELYNWGT